MWDFNTAECFTLRGHREWVNQVKIWSPDSSDCSATPTTYTDTGDEPAQTAQTSTPPSIKLLFSASDDCTLKVWDLVTRQCVRTFEGHVAQVQCLKILSIDDNSRASFPSGPTEDEKISYINASAAVNRNHSQVTAENGYDGFFEQYNETIPANTELPGFVCAGNVRPAIPPTSAFLEAAARPPPDPASLPFVDFGGKAPLIISGSLDKYAGYLIHLISIPLLMHTSTQHYQNMEC